VIGTVPVEADGSAYFRVPADTAVYFQALDENQMELVRMRSYVSLKAGEVRSCRGCHESRGQPPAVSALAPAALRREPVIPTPPPWGSDRLLGYEWLVQPILDQHCTRCHSPEKPEGGLDLSGVRHPDGFLQSFHALFSGPLPGAKEWPAWKAALDQQGQLPLVSVSSRFSNCSVTQPQEFGSHKSRFILTLLQDERHRQEVRLSEPQWQALVTWVDTNAPYYDTYVQRRDEHGTLLPAAKRVPIRLPPAFPASCTGPSERITSGPGPRGPLSTSK
jgi:hypothetical protein